METGLFVTFLDEHEGPERELPPVGPLEQLVIRHKVLVCERTTVQQADDIGASIDRWLEAELELQRAMGSEPGGARRQYVRVTARDGVLVRFALFGDAAERDLVPELGPFAVVHVRRYSVEADGQVLATRKASEIAPWELASAAGAEHAGLSKGDIAFRTPTTAYHPQIGAPPARRPAADAADPAATPSRGTALTRATSPTAVPTPDPPPPVAETATPIEPPAPAAPPAPSPREPLSPPAPQAVPSPTTPEPPALTPQDLQLIERIEREREEETLRARMQEEERRRLGVTPETEDPALTWAMRYRSTVTEEAAAGQTARPERELDLRDVLWRLRFAVIGILLLGVGGYGFLLFTGRGTAPGAPGGANVRTIGIAQKVQSVGWEYVVNGTQRVQQAGSSTAAGVYYVVRVGVTNRRTEGLSLSPSDFGLVGPDGTQYAALGLASGAYQGPDNTGSPYFWPQSFPLEKTVTMGIIFDIPPSVGRGLELTLPDLPNVRVKLD